MKAEFTDLGATRKSVAVEVPSADVDLEIERLSQRYRRSVRVPGFRPGKAPVRLVRQRMRGRLLEEAAQALVEKAVAEALRERGVEPLDAPAVRDVEIDEGRPLTFTATFETLPPVGVIEYRGLTVRRTPIHVTDVDVSDALDRLRQRAARSEPVEGRGAAAGDIVTVDLTRRIAPPPGASGPSPAPDRRAGVRIEIGAAANPPGFDEHVAGLGVGGTATFRAARPAGGEAPEPAGAEVEYDVRVTGVHQRVPPALDDAFARSVSGCDTLDALRERVAEELRADAARETDRRMRDDLLKQLASRMPDEVPETLVARELDRRAESLAAQLAAQRIDPRRAGLDWEAFRDTQREPAAGAVKSTLALDEIARLERIEAAGDEIDRRIARLAERDGRSAAAMRALIEKEGGVAALAAGIRREKAIDFVLAHATIVTA